MTSIERDLLARDKQLIWHPFTQEQAAPPRLAVERGQGAWLYDFDGNAYLDLVSSWWVNLFGHARTEIADSIRAQAGRLEHVLFAGCTHEPAVQLCEALDAMLPAALSRYFYSDNGSTAVEVALKMAYQFWKNTLGQERQLFIGFEGGYHGDTFGAMSVGAHCGYHDAFRSLFFHSLAIPFPHTWQGDATVAQKEQAALTQLRQALVQNPGKVAAIIIEPLVQGASGMRMCRPGFVAQVHHLAREHQTLVIFDEVMTGFGRTGSRFALEQSGVAPDFLCLSKGITGGFLPLAMTVTTDRIYEAFLSEAADKTFSHGHSYTANPLACAAALASMRLLASDETTASLAELARGHEQGIAQLKERIPVIERPRIQGTIAAFDLPAAFPLSGRQLHARCLEQGLLLRPIGSSVYLLPPYVVSSMELAAAYEKLADVLRMAQLEASDATGRVQRAGSEPPLP